MRGQKHGRSGSGGSDMTSVIDVLSPIPEENVLKTHRDVDTAEIDSWWGIDRTGAEEYDQYVGDSDDSGSSVISFSVIARQVLTNNDGISVQPSDDDDEESTPTLASTNIFPPKRTKIAMQSSPIDSPESRKSPGSPGKSQLMPTLRRLKTGIDLRKMATQENNDFRMPYGLAMGAVSPDTWRREFNEEMERLSSDSPRYKEPGMVSVSSASIATIQASRSEDLPSSGLSTPVGAHPSLDRLSSSAEIPDQLHQLDSNLHSNLASSTSHDDDDDLANRRASTVSSSSRYSSGSAALLPPPRIAQDPLTLASKRQHQRNLSITDPPVRASVYSQFSQYSPVVEEIKRVEVRQMTSNDSAKLSTTTGGGGSSSSTATTSSATVRTVSINRARASVKELESMLTEIQTLRRSISEHSSEDPKIMTVLQEDEGSDELRQILLDHGESSRRSQSTDSGRPDSNPSISEEQTPAESTTSEPLPASAPTTERMVSGNSVGIRSISGGSKNSRLSSQTDKPLPNIPASKLKKHVEINSEPPQEIPKSVERSSSLKKKLFPWIGRKSAPKDEDKESSSSNLPDILSTPPLATNKRVSQLLGQRASSHSRQISTDTQWSSGTSYESSTDDLDEMKSSIEVYRASLNALNNPSASSSQSSGLRNFTAASVQYSSPANLSNLSSLPSHQQSARDDPEGPAPQLPHISSLWKQQLSLKQEMEEFILQPPPSLPFSSKSQHNSTQESSAESFQTAMSSESEGEDPHLSKETAGRPQNVNSEAHYSKIPASSPGQSSGTNTVTAGVSSFTAHTVASATRSVPTTATVSEQSVNLEDGDFDADADAERRESAATTKTQGTESKVRGSIPSIAAPYGSVSHRPSIAVPPRSPERPPQGTTGHSKQTREIVNPRQRSSQDRTDELHRMTSWQREPVKRHGRHQSHTGSINPRQSQRQSGEQQNQKQPPPGQRVQSDHRSVSMPTNLPKSASTASRGADRLSHSRKAFSQANIAKLMSLADSSFKLDDIDLPPEEKHLLEKFVDALSKLSVEINLDDGKRLEGKRRLHNALRAIEGWI